jgi:hypothetical protein
VPGRSLRFSLLRHLWESRGNWSEAIVDQAGLWNISADPIFCNRFISNYAISASSECAPAQAGSCGLIGAFGVACTEVPVERATWGRIKTLFR